MGTTIIFIDDNLELLEVYSMILNSTLHDVVVQQFTNPFSAMERINQIMDANVNENVVVITDLRMEQMNGLHVVHAVHNNWPTIPIILLTGFCDEKVSEEAKRLGAALVLDKSTDIDALLEGIRKLLPP